MPKRPQFKSDAFEAIHSVATGLYRAGAIDEAVIGEFDESCCLKKSQRQVLRLDDFTETDLQSIRDAEPPEEANFFNHEALRCNGLQSKTVVLAIHTIFGSN
jgi:DNA-binding transcriptional regulator YiaG